MATRRISRQSAVNWVVVALLLLGFFLRVLDLTGTPPGIDGDEAFYYLDASRLLQGLFRLYFSTNYGVEPMFIYMEAVMLRLLGSHAFALRYTAVVGGMLSLAACYALGHRMLGRRVGLVALVLLATLPWPILFTRLGLRAFTLLMMSLFSLYTFWRALEDRSWRWAVAAGLCNGLSVYTYASARVFPAVPLLWLGALAITDRRRLAANGRQVAVALGLALIIMGPLALYIIENPDIANQRFATMSTTVSEIQRGDFSTLLPGLAKTAGMFTFVGDPQPRWDPGGRPVFDPLSGALFYLGLLLAIWHWRRPAYTLLLIWLSVMLAPVALTSSIPSFSRAVGALFPIVALPGVGLAGLLDLITRRWPPATNLVGRYFEPATVVGGIGLSAATLAVLFGPWRTSPAIMAVYESDLYTAARYADNAPAGVNVFIVADNAGDMGQAMGKLQALYPDRARYSAGLVWPASSGPVWYLFTSEVLPDALTRAWLGAAPAWQETDGSGATILEGYELPGPPPLPQPTHPSGAWFDQFADILGVTYQPAALERGSSGEIILFWRVRSDARVDPRDPPRFFIKLISGAVVWASGSASLDLSPDQWRPGDILVQRIPLTAIPSDAPSIPVDVELTALTRTGYWPVIPEGEAVARTRLLLPPVQLTGHPAPDLAPQSLAQFGDDLLLLQVNSALEAMPGAPISLHTQWQARRKINRDYQLQVHLLAADGHVWAETTGGLWSGQYPTRAWAEREVVSSYDSITPPGDTPPGDYFLQLRLVDPASGQAAGRGAWVAAGSVHIAGRARLFAPPAMDARVGVQFSSFAQLAGYRLDTTQARPGGSIKLTLVWEALGPAARPLKVFTHLYGLGNTVDVLAQHDGEPRSGNAPTHLWVAGEYVEDEHTIALDPALGPGTYRIGVGMYDPDSLERVFLITTSGQQTALILGSIQIP